MDFFWGPKRDPRRQTILYVRLGGFLRRAALPEARAPAAPESIVRASASGDSPGLSYMYVY